MNRALILRTFIISSLLASGLCIVCISNTGTPVDWYIVYKLPMISNSQNSNVRSGKAYYYMDENDKSFQLQTHAIDDMNTPMAYTLNPIYGNVL
ncbi:Plancitoxin-1 [Bulinus truncatus]|nr:Plancitoxin-1 [Bulinus truncatus]